MIYEFFRLFGLILGFPINLLFFKRKTYYEGGKKIKLKKGAKLIIGNHYNLLDYIMCLFMVFPRKLVGVTSEMPFRSRIVRFGMKFFGAVQANRETKDLSFINKASEILDNGGLVEIFPEGRNTPDGKIHDFKHSYLLIAHRSQCKIQPVVSDGNYGFFKRVRVVVGKEIDIAELLPPEVSNPSKEQLEKANAYVFNKVSELREFLEEKKREEKVC